MKRILIALTLVIGTLGLSLNASEPKPVLTKKQAQDLVAHAKTAADHLKLAVYYKQASENFLAQSKYHEQMKASYQSNSVYSSSKFKANTLDHCDYFVKSFQEDAAKMKELAAMHEEMARQTEAK